MIIFIRINQLDGWVNSKFLTEIKWASELENSSPIEVAKALEDANFFYENLLPKTNKTMNDYIERVRKEKFNNTKKETKGK